MRQPKDRVTIAVVGLNFGDYIIRQITDGPGGEFLKLVGVCDWDAEKRTRRAASLNVRAYATLDDVLADSTVEAVGLFTSPNGRAALIRRILHAGKHVLTTKPFERDADDALAVLREAEQAGLTVALNSPSPLLPPDLALVEKWRQEFDLGHPVAARLDVWASYHETADGRWYDAPAQCPVAPLFRIGVYLVNDAVRLFGEASQVTVVSSRLRTGRPTPDNAQMSLLFHSGAVASIFASFCVDDGDAHRNAMVLNFERGTVYRNCGPVQSSGRESGTDMALVMRGEQGREVAAQVVLGHYNPQHVYQWEVFCRQVRGEHVPGLVRPELVAAGIRVLEAMAEAEAHGGTAAVQRVTAPEASLVGL